MGATYRLEEPWVYNCALYTLHTWCAFGVDKPLRFHQLGFFEEIPFQEEAFTLFLKPADLKLRTIEEEKARFDESYREARDEYFSKLAAKVEQQWPKAAKPEELERHLEWLVHYRINQLSIPTLAKRYHRSKTTLYDALRNLHSLLKLTPVRHTPGRPQNG